MVVDDRLGARPLRHAGLSFAESPGGEGPPRARAVTPAGTNARGACRQYRRGLGRGKRPGVRIATRPSKPTASTGGTLAGLTDTEGKGMTASEMAQHHVEIAEKLLDRIKIEKRLGREMDVKDANNAAVAASHATLALYYQREAHAGQ